MPFDEKRFIGDDALGKTILFLSDPQNWCHFDSRMEGSHLCILHALWLHEDPFGGPTPALAAISQARRELFPDRQVPRLCGLDSLAQFNDHPDTTHADVMRVLLRARELLAP